VLNLGQLEVPELDEALSVGEGLDYIGLRRAKFIGKEYGQGMSPVTTFRYVGIFGHDGEFVVGEFYVYIDRDGTLRGNFEYNESDDEAYETMQDAVAAMNNFKPSHTASVKKADISDEDHTAIEDELGFKTDVQQAVAKHYNLTDLAALKEKLEWAYALEEFRNWNDVRDAFFDYINHGSLSKDELTEYAKILYPLLDEDDREFLQEQSKEESTSAPEFKQVIFEALKPRGGVDAIEWVKAIFNKNEYDEIKTPGGFVLIDKAQSKTGAAKQADGDWGVRWREFAGREGRLVVKEKFFKTELMRDKFVEKVQEKDNFYEIDSYYNPNTTTAVEADWQGQPIEVWEANHGAEVKPVSGIEIGKPYKRIPREVLEARLTSVDARGYQSIEITLPDGRRAWPISVSFEIDFSLRQQLLNWVGTNLERIQADLSATPKQGSAKKALDEVLKQFNEPTRDPRADKDDSGGFQGKIRSEGAEIDPALYRDLLDAAKDTQYEGANTASKKDAASVNSEGVPYQSKEMAPYRAQAVKAAYMALGKKKSAARLQVDDVITCKNCGKPVYRDRSRVKDPALTGMPLHYYNDIVCDNCGDALDEETAINRGRKNTETERTASDPRAQYETLYAVVPARLVPEGKTEINLNSNAFLGVVIWKNTLEEAKAFADQNHGYKVLEVKKWRGSDGFNTLEGHVIASGEKGIEIHKEPKLKPPSNFRKHIDEDVKEEIAESKKGTAGKVQRL
jgi:hypothetical protein